MRTRLGFAALLVGAACGGGTTSDEIKIDSVTPNFGPLAGGTRVTLHGTGFLRDSAAPDRVLIGGVEAPLAGAINDTDLEVEVPAGQNAGDAEIVVINHNGYGKASGVFHYSSLPTIASVTPSDVVFSSTSTNVTITGSGFKDEDAGFLRVLVDGNPAVDVMVQSDTQLSFTALPGQALASADVTVEDARGEVLKVGAFRYTPGTRSGLLLFPQFSPTVFCVFFDPADSSVVTITFRDNVMNFNGYRSVVQDADGSYFGARRDNKWGQIDLKTQQLPDDAVQQPGQYPGMARVGNQIFAFQRSPAQFGTIDKVKGSFTRIGSQTFGSPGQQTGLALAADANGNLIAVVPVAPNQPRIGTIDKVTGVLSSPQNLPLGTHVTDMRFMGASLFAMTKAGDLITINPNTGGTAIVHGFGQSFGAMEVFQ